jgi:SAM-dependent methyltransferase
MEQAAEWFEHWFDSPYYHLLYRHRDDQEARGFLDLLIARVPLAPGSTVLDVACGRGRHAIYLNSRGFDVTGFDLSEQNILHNLGFEKKGLHFYRHDMRQVIRVNYFDYAINLFSSFGYFDRYEENLHAMRSTATALRQGGTCIFDYANCRMLRTTLEPENAEEVDGLSFRMKRYVQEPFIVKEIEVTDKGATHRFCEKLRIFEPDELTAMMEACGLNVRSLYGDYSLGAFDAERSPRLIVVADRK